MAKRRQGEPPVKPHNKAVRKNEFIERDKVEALIKAARQLGRHGDRDSAMCLIAFRHALRAKEITSMLDWHQVDLQAKEIKILRCKDSEDGDHTMERDEVSALKGLKPKPDGPIFVNERGGQMSENSFHKIVQRAGIKAGLGGRIHPHMLRHACGYDMARRGLPLRHIQDWMGHKNVNHTIRYTKLGPEKFKKVRMW